jgi:hypothetical protein
MQETTPSHVLTFPGAPEAEGQRNGSDSRGSLSPDARPHGHVVVHGPGDPAPRSLDGHPHGRVVGHGPGDPAPHALDSRPHGHVIGHGIPGRTAERNAA